jgi:hypothetical protein
MGNLLMNFKEYLEEGRDAPLYHSTNFTAIKRIIQYDKLEGYTDHYDKFMAQDFYGEFNPKKNVKMKHFTSRESMRGISLTRSLKSAENWRGGHYIIKLNQRKLAQRHKIIPINIYAAAGKNKHAKDEELFEEFVIGSIKNLHEYTECIIFQRSSDMKKVAHVSNFDKFKYFSSTHGTTFTGEEIRKQFE